MKIVFGGDLFIGGDLLNESSVTIDSATFSQADFRVVNLEHPISDNDIIAEKCTLFSGTDSIKYLKELKIGAVNLANNHIQDKGTAGIVETINSISRADIQSFGAGVNINEASKPMKINDELVILGYCEHGKEYLNQIQIASDDSPGVNPLSYDKIVSDLELLSDKEHVIIYLHWGREHVMFPPIEDINIARRLLNLSKVVGVMGSHSHLSQGLIRNGSKRAYMSLGNTLFPNFYIKPPTQLMNGSTKIHSDYTTRFYHSVDQVTYKKWKLGNRISTIVEYDTDSEKMTHRYLYQMDNSPSVVEPNEFFQILLRVFFAMISSLYGVTPRVYCLFERGNSFYIKKLWRINGILFDIKQNGTKPFLIRVKLKIYARMNIQNSDDENVA
jgi:hypothetical protein